MMNEKIYINKNDLKVLSKDNNTIGLHSIVILQILINYHSMINFEN